MNATTAAAVLRAEESGDRTGFSFGTFLGIGPGLARRGWFRRHAVGQFEWVARTWKVAVSEAIDEISAVSASNDRDAVIAGAVASGTAVAAVAAIHDLTPARVGQIARAAGVETRPGRKPTGAATPHTARGRALLSRLVSDAKSAGLEPEAYLDRLRS